MIGPGRYDDICTAARQAAEAYGCIVIILGGTQGSGFSCQAPVEFMKDLPAVLRRLAGQIEEDVRNDLATRKAQPKN